jgi:uncharacterized protein (DUF433 family)
LRTKLEQMESERGGNGHHMLRQWKAPLQRTESVGMRRALAAALSTFQGKSESAGREVNGDIARFASSFAGPAPKPWCSRLKSMMEARLARPIGSFSCEAACSEVPAARVVRRPLLGYSDESDNRRTPMTYQDRITRDPAICAGQPVIRGTRVLVRVILGYLAHGETLATLLSDFPSLTEEDVRAVIAFAAAAAAEDLPAPSPLPPDIKVA